jgi:MYXO-CTERM domain-containing protein
MIGLLVHSALAAAPAGYYDLGLVLRGTEAFAAGVGAPAVEYDGDAEAFVMYFESPAPAAEVPAGCANSYRIGRATSPDGVSWAVDAEPVFGPDGLAGSPRTCSAAQPAVVFDGTTWNLFYSASTVPNEGAGTNAPSGIGWATSADGVTWTPQAEALVPFAGPSIGLASATVLNGTVYLLYSQDPDLWMVSRPAAGGAWTAPTKVLDHTTVGEWGGDWVLGPSLLCDADAAAPLALLFGGDSTAGDRSLAWATSADGAAWAVDAAGPLAGGTLDYGALNHWDTLRAGEGHVLWYSQTDPASGKKAIGAAVSDTRLGTPQPRVCPNPWAPVDAPVDTATPDDTGDTAEPAGPDEGGCGCTTGGESAFPELLAGLATVGAARRRTRRDKA